MGSHDPQALTQSRGINGVLAGALTRVPGGLVGSTARVDVQANFERGGLRLRLSGPRRQAVLDLRGFALLTGLGWLALIAAVGLFYRGISSDPHFVSGVASLIVAAALASFAHRRLARTVEDECLANGMSELEARRCAREIVFQLWTRKGERAADGGRLRGLLEDFPA